MAGRKFASVSYVDEDGSAAAREAVAELKRQLGGPPTWVMAFFSAELDADQVAAGLARSLPAGTQVVGCSSYAEIDSAEALTRSVALLGARAPALSVQTAALQPDGRSAHALGQELARRFQAFAPQLIVLLPDVLTVNATQLLRGVQSVLGNGCPVIGGAAADDGGFKRTFLLCGSQVQSSGVVALALKGPLRVATAARSGYTPVSVPRIATAVERGNILLSLNDRPALDVYREFLGARASEMPGVSIEFPLGCVSSVRPEAPELIRAIFGVDEQRRALILGGDVPQGGPLRILSATRADVLSGARAATQLAMQALPDPDVALVFNCMSRKVAMGAQYKEEYAGARSLLPAALPVLGFYTFGELSPLHGTSEHHESTYTLALLKVDDAGRA